MTARSRSTDRNGYAPSILQTVSEQSWCFLCGRCDRKLDRHEVFHGPFRTKSKEYGLWLMLCHEGCHQGRGSVHDNGELDRKLKRSAQKTAMRVYGWTESDFIREFGKNYL